MQRFSSFLLNLILLFSLVQLNAQENSKNYGSPEFQVFHDSVSKVRSKQKIALQMIDQYKVDNAKNLDCNQKALLYRLQGSVYYAKYDDLNAIKFWRDSSLYYWNQCDNKSEYHFALIHANIGNSYRWLKKYDLASQYLQKATSLWAEIEDIPKSWLAGKLLDQASFYSLIGDGYNAELIHDRVENILPEINDKTVEAKLHDIKCNHSFTIGRFRDAIDYGNLAIDFYEKDQPKNFKKIIVNHYNIANSFIDLEDYIKALFHLERMNDLFSSYGKTKDYENYLNLKSIVLKRLGRYAESKEIITSKLKIILSEDPLDVAALADSYENMGDVYNEEGDYDKAMELYLKARDLYVPEATTYRAMLKEEIQSFRDPLKLVVCLGQISKTKNLQYRATNDIKYLNDATAIYEDIELIFEKNRLSAYNEVKKSIASDKIKVLYQEAVRTYLALYRSSGDNKFLEQSYKYASINKSLLQKERSRNNKIFHQYLPDSLTSKETGLTKVINATYSALQSEKDAFRRDSLYGQLSQLQQEYEEYIGALEKKYPKYHSEIFAPVNPLSIIQVQQNLGKGELLLDYYFGSDSLYCFAISENSCEIQGIANLNGITETILLARESVESGGKLQNGELEDLYNLFVGAYLDESTESLLIVRDEELLKLPFEVLRTDGKYLIEQFPVSYMFSNTDLAKSIEPTEHKEQFLGFGSKYSKNLNETLSNLISSDFLPLANLLKAPEEIQNSSKIWRGKSFINGQATKENFIANSHTASILHLAMHGIINHKYPDQSALIFDDRAEDSVLKLNEICQLNLNSDLVILSSCHSGSGKIFKAEGTQSLARGFAIAGSASVLSSLWAAYDDPTSMIMSEFNRNLLNGDNKAVALQKAKISYLDNAFPTLRSPKYWSNLILIGDSSPIIVSKSSNYMLLITVGLILLLALLLYIFRKKPK